MRPVSPLKSVEQWLSLERFDYSRIARQWAELRLLARLADQLGAPAQAMLVVTSGPLREAFPARACGLERRLGAREPPSAAGALLWRVSFAVPLELVEFERTLFALTATDQIERGLPRPKLRPWTPQALRFAEPGAPTSARRRGQPGGQMRHRIAALSTAVVITALSSPAASLAATGLTGHAAPGADLGTRATPVTGSENPVPPQPRVMQPIIDLSAAPVKRRTASSKKRVGRPARHTETTITRVFSAPAQPSIPRPGPASSNPTSPSTHPAPRAPSSPPNRLLTPAPLRPPASHHLTGDAKRHSHGHAGPADPSGGAPLLPPRRPAGPVKRGTDSDDPTTSASPGSTQATNLPSPATFSAPTAWSGTVSTDPSLAGALSNLSGPLADGDHPPAFLIPIYIEAGRRYDVPWQILAAINGIESDYGRDLSTSSAGAVGWMQFEPGTWREYGRPVDGHDVANPYDPRDAIFAAARYLAAAGAAQNISGAVLAYNHAGWYVAEVLSRARAIAASLHPGPRKTKRGVVSVYFADPRREHHVAVYRGGVMSHYDRLIASANMVSAADFPYLYGGGHEQPARFGPFDCSGSVSYVIQQAGYLAPTTVSGEIPIWKFPAGPGRVTIFYNVTHTFMRIGNRYFGTSGFARPGGGAGWFDTARLPASYLAQFRQVHVPRLGVNSFAPAAMPATTARSH
jgi:Transglycosylase SLT domain